MAQDDFEYSPSEIRENLEKSLDYNPEDKETWLKLVNLKQQQASKRYKTINVMLNRFPEDTEVLTIGIEAAIQRSAFKKASTLAGKLLNLRTEVNMHSGVKNAHVLPLLIARKSAAVELGYIMGWYYCFQVMKKRDCSFWPKEKNSRKGSFLHIC